MFMKIKQSKSLERSLSIGIPILAFLLGLWYFCFRILGVGLEFIPGDLGDSRFINYLLEHGYQWSTGSSPSFWNVGFMYPFENVLAFSDNMIGTMPFYGMWRLLGFTEETAYQLWWVIMCSLNYWSAYFVLKRWFHRWDLATIGALIFAFSIFNLGQLNYMQMMVRFMVPVVIYSGARMVEAPSWKYVAVFTFGIVYQFYGVIYTGFFLLYFSLFFIGMYAIVRKNPWFFLTLFRGRQLFPTLLTTFLAIACLSWLMIPYYQISSVSGLRMFDEVNDNIPVLQSYLYAPKSAFLWNSLGFNTSPNVPTPWLHYTFPGIIPLFALISIPFFWVYWKIRNVKVDRLVLAFSIVAFLIFLLLIRTSDGYTLYALIFKLPGMNSMRVLNRFMHVELFFLIFIVIALLRNVHKMWSIILFLLVILDNSFSAEKVIRSQKSNIAERRLETIALVRKNLTVTHEAYALVGGEKDVYIYQLDAMIASNSLNVPTINGYSSSNPPLFKAVFIHPTRESVSKWLKVNDLDCAKVLIVER